LLIYINENNDGASGKKKKGFFLIF
jgi:hypothetical protein